MSVEKSNVYEPKNAALEAPKKLKEAAFKFCESYVSFLDNAKTEREAVRETVACAEACGYREFHFGDSVKKGERIYYINRSHAVILASVAGDLSEGVQIVCAHIDSPRIDLKPNPLYEDGGIGFFRTHYYGGLKQYQWPTVPLALHGVVVKEDGTEIEICVGEKEGDPIFCISDLLPHLEKDREKKSLAEGFNGEMLSAVVGSIPSKAQKEPIVEEILAYLKKTYNIEAEDFISAELSLVPAYKARDIGFDRSLIGAYAHDDRVCAYPALRALVDAKKQNKTCIVVLADKEEIGSDGITGLNSNYLRDFLYELAENFKVNPRVMLQNSLCLSADVTAAFDPTYAEAYEKKNAAFLNRGVSVSKYTGHGGKYSTSDAPAKTVAKVRAVLNRAGVYWQSAELGKVDQGGGGTLAKYVAKLNIEVVDLGVPLLSMHAPYEIAAKLDIYETYRACLAFFEG